jgi:hypothetical protein
MLETELFKPLKAFADKNGYSLWAEVANKAVRENRVVDSVIYDKQNYWAIELKTTLKIEVIAQAVRNLKYFNYSIIATPAVNKVNLGRRFAYEIIKNYGLGLIEIYPTDDNKLVIPNDDPFTIKPKFNERTKEDRFNVERWLFEEQKKSIGGVNTHDEYSRKKEAINLIKEFLKLNNVITLEDALSASCGYFPNTKEVYSALKLYGSDFCKIIIYDGKTLFEYKEKENE